MGLFDRKRTNYHESQPLYTLGNSQTLLVVGLGNVGREYAHNRHNVGFMAVDRYKEAHSDFSEWIEKRDLHCYLSTGNIGSTRVVLVKPTTLMNLSGESVQAIQHFYKIGNEDTVVVYDELDIEFGTVRTRIGGTSAGHNGVKSLIQHIGDPSEGGFGRIRVGIGPKTPVRMATADFVLQDFSEEQKPLLTKIIREVCALIDERTTGPLSDQSIKIA
jgi:peptidyl-tRNA hydrolase, PTH1 family